MANPTSAQTARYISQGGKAYEVKQTGAQFFYWSPITCRWLPVAKSKVSFA